MYRILALDGNYLIMRSNSAFADLTTSDGRSSGALYGYISSFRRFIQKYHPRYVVPLFDYGRSTYRSSIDASYKSDRKAKTPELLAQMDACREFISLIGGTPYFEYGVEADDLAAKIAKDYGHDGEYSVLLLSADHDWQQLVGDHVVLLRPKGRGDGEDVISYDIAEERLGWPPERWAEVAAIMGDPGDHVIGLRGYGWKRSLRAVSEHGDLWTAIEEDPKLKSNAATILRNYDLVKLTGDVPTVPVPLEQNRVKRLDASKRNERLIEFLLSWDMRSFVDMVNDGEFI